MAMRIEERLGISRVLRAAEKLVFADGKVGQASDGIYDARTLG